MRFAVATLAAACAALPAMAQVGVWRLEACGLAGIGGEGCSPAEASLALDALEPAWGLALDRNDPYAIVTILGTLKQAIDQRIEVGLCGPGEDAAYEVSEIWAMYVGDVPEGATAEYEEEFAVLRRFVEAGVAYLDDGECSRP